MDPINYSGMLTQLDLSPLQRGLGMRRDNRQQDAQIQNQQAIRQLAEQKFSAEMANDQAYQQALTEFKANPTSQGVLDLSARFPDHAKALEDGFKTYTAGQQQDIIRTTTTVLGALHAGNRDLAVQNLTERRDALRRAGVDTTHTDAAIKMVQSNDPAEQKQGQAYLAMVLTGAIGGEAASGILDRFGYGAKAENQAADNARADATAAETARHNRVMEGQGAARVDLSRAAGARAAAKGAGKGKSGGSKLPTGFVLD